MGMYTQIHFGSALKKETPAEVIDVLKYMVGDADAIPEKLPDHPLFKTDRWGFMLRCDSYYFDYKTMHEFRFDDIAGQYYLSVTSNFKNYDGEIARFVDWILPYCDKQPGDFLGYSRYETIETPTIIYVPEEPHPFEIGFQPRVLK